MIPASTPVYTSVIVRPGDHPRTGQAGVVIGSDPAHPETIAVKFDIDGATAAVALVDLDKLG